MFHAGNRLLRRVLLSLPAVVVVALPGTAQEVRSNTRGLVLGANVHGSSLKVEEGSRESGGGVGITAGWGVSRQVAIFFHGDIVKMDITDPEIEGDYSIGVAELGVRLSLRSAEDRFIPHITAAIAAQRATASVEIAPSIGTDIEIRGPAFTLGGGFAWFFTRTAAFDLSLLLTSGRFNEIRFGNLSADIGDLDSQAARLNLGFLWFPLLP
jgi:hypothetical protein